MHSSESGSPDERGIALAIALFALVVIGGIIAGTYAAGVLELQTGRNTLYGAQAAEAAEAELREITSNTPASALVAIPVGGAPLDLGAVSLGDGVRVVRRIVRLTDNLFLVHARGTRVNADGTPLATRSIGLLVGVAVDSTTGRDSVVPLAQRAWVQLY
jgi:hypothetical protein